MIKVTKDDGAMTKKYGSRPANGEKNKLTSLAGALREHVRPGMNLYISPEGGSAICELIRQFRGTRPEFTFTIAVFVEHAINLIHCGLARKLITTSCTHLYPNSGVSNVIRQAYAGKEVEIENWSLYSLQQRMMAGALGVGFMPTKSVVGSSMADENAESFAVVDDPFDPGEKIGVVRGLNPDLAIVHAWAADCLGNTIGVSTAAQNATDHNMWGVKASREGAIVTAERIVSTDFIMEHSSLVTIPGYLVKAVCHAPYGAHPAGMFTPIPGLFASYAPDYDFITEHRKASEDAQVLDEWLAEWVFGCPGHADYVAKLGEKRTTLLEERAKPGYWEKEYGKLPSPRAGGQPPNEREIMILVAARAVAARMRKGRLRVLLGGVGAGILASWLAFYLLRQEGYPVDLVLGSGPYGYEPRFGDPFYGSLNNLHTCKAVFDTAGMYGYFIAGRNSRSLSVLGAAQVDKYGNINSTRTQAGYMIGSGGANDAANAADVVVVTRQSRHRFVDRVAYITCPGRHVRTVVSHLGVLEKSRDGQELQLVGCLPGLAGEGIEGRIKRIKDECGWDLKVSDRVEDYPMPGDEELVMLRAFDPEGLLSG